MLPMEVKVNLYGVLKKQRARKRTTSVKLMENEHILHKYYD